MRKPPAFALHSVIQVSISAFQKHDIKLGSVDFHLQLHRIITAHDHSGLCELAIHVYAIEAGLKVAENKSDSVVA